MYISYKEFSKNREQTLEEYKSFYETRFPGIFKWFYPSMREDGFVPYATRAKNRNRRFNEGTANWSPHFLVFHPEFFEALRDGTPLETTNLPEQPKDELGVHSMGSHELYFFSVGVFFRALIPQVIYKVAGKDVWLLFYKAAAWPMMSAGLGGFVSAEQWVYETGDELFPIKEESPYYNALLDIVLGFHSEELTEFLKGNRPCYDPESFAKLNALVKDKIEAISDELFAATEAAKENFSNGEHPVYYLTM